MIIYDYQFSMIIYLSKTRCTENKSAAKQKISLRAEQFHVLFWVFCSLNLTIKPYNKSFIDQACSVKLAGYWPRSVLRFFVHKNAKKRTWPISSHLDLTLGQ